MQQNGAGLSSPIEVPAFAGTTGVPAPVANVILNGQAVILNGVKNLGFLPGMLVSRENFRFFAALRMTVLGGEWWCCGEGFGPE